MDKLTRRKMLALASCALTGSLVYAAPNSNEPKILSARLQSNRTKTRIVLESDQKIAYRHFNLDNPHRLVVDLTGIHQSQTLSQITRQLKGDNGIIRQIRFGQKDANTLRMVLDLNRALPIQVTALAPSGKQKHRIQIDLGHGNLPQATPTFNANDDPLGDLLAQKRNQPNNKQPASTQQPSKPAAPRKPIIMIDPGHGGKDPGASGKNTGIHEKDVVLATSLELRSRLQAKGYVVHMTRSDDTFVPLRERRKKARDVNADLFISIHANAVEDAPAARGTDVFVLGRANSERARRSVAVENKVDFIDGIPSVGNKDVDNILTDMLETQTTASSTRLGNLILRQVARHAKVHNSTAELGNFVILRSLDMPSVLVEMGFLSNPQDEKLLASQDFRRQMANSIANAVQEYLRNVVLN